MAISNELVQLLSFKMSDQSKAAFNNFKNGLNEVRNSMAKVSAVAVSTGSAIAYTIKAISDQAVALDNLSQRTGISTNTLQEYQYAAEAVGVSAEAVTGDLQSLMETMSSPIPGEFNEALFMMGINIRDASGQMKSADALLGDIGDKLNNMSQQKALQWASRLGLSDDTLTLIKQGRLGLAELRKEAEALGAVIPEEALKRGAEFKKSLNALEFAFKGIGRTVALSVTPGLTGVVNSIKQWIVANSQLIKQGLEKTVTGVGNGFSDMWTILVRVKNATLEFLQPLRPLVENLDIVKVLAGVIVGTLSGFLILLIPIIAKMTLLAAGFTAGALALQDFVYWCMGGESALGKLIDKWDNWANRWKKESWWKAAIAGVATLPQQMGEAFADTFGGGAYEGQGAYQQMMGAGQTTINNSPNITIMTGANAQEVVQAMTPFVSTAQKNTPGQFTPFAR